MSVNVMMIFADELMVIMASPVVSLTARFFFQFSCSNHASNSFYNSVRS